MTAQGAAAERDSCDAGFGAHLLARPEAAGASGLFCRMLLASAGSLSPLRDSPRVRRLYRSYTGLRAPTPPEGTPRAATRVRDDDSLDAVPARAPSTAVRMMARRRRGHGALEDAIMCEASERR